MMKKLLLLSILISCSPKSDLIKTEYPQAIGNIDFDKSQDGEFARCGFLPLDTMSSFTNSYYGIGGGFHYDSEMHAIKEHFKEHYKSPNIIGESGFIIIRFLVNCRGETGMFRISCMDSNLREREFEATILQQILTLTKELNKWKPLGYKGNMYDYHQYLSFKILNGNIKDITP